MNLQRLYLLLWTRIPWKKWSSHHSQQKSPKCTTWMQSQNNRMISVCFQGKPFNITVIQAYAPTGHAADAEVKWFYKDLQELLELTPKKRCPFLYRGLECKNRKSRDTWINRQIWLQGTKSSRAKANRVLPRERTGRSIHPLPTTREDSTHGQHQMVNTEIRLITFFAAKDGEALYSQQKQDWEQTVAQIMNSLLPNSDLN